tara:strand:+ start:203 stop:817 length:615 start_codon:yes stop_codon:yes gene_type:complete
MTLPDQRIRLTATKVDFTNDVGTTGQAHDSFPAPGQARFDHMRMFLIGLLSNQASYDEPLQYRDGTIWFDLNTNAFKVNIGGNWKLISDAVNIDPTDTTVTLSSWYETVNSVIQGFIPEVTFSGDATSTTNLIPIPVSLGTSNLNRCFVWVNGLLLDPRKCEISGESVRLINSTVKSGDRYTIVLKKMLAADFYTPDTSAPRQL